MTGEARGHDLGRPERWAHDLLVAGFESSWPGLCSSPPGTEWGIMNHRR